MRKVANSNQVQKMESEMKKGNEEKQQT